MVESSLFGPATEAPKFRAFARVAVERGIDSLDGPEGFTYGCPGAPPAVGERVLVPLGRGDKTAPGVVLEVGGSELAAGLKQIKAIREQTGAVLPASLLALGAWMAEYYVCPLGMALATVMPAAVKAGTGRRSVEMVDLAGSPEPSGKLTSAAARVWAQVLTWEKSEFPMPLRVLAARAGVGTVGPARRLVDAGLLRLFESSQVTAAALPGAGRPAQTVGVEATPEQTAAVEGIGAGLGAFGVHLLRGVTGSGKTEVYLRVIERVLSLGQCALVLVPEIALTPQTSARFTARLGAGRVAVLHSGLSGSQRHREWKRACDGEAPVVVGARSAVFAPLTNLGLIVVDEEHDSSYKQDRLPRYNGRDVAIKRGHLEGCPVVLGSATPSLESWANATGPSARYRLWHLPRRVGGATLPPVRIVDMGEERRLRWQQAPDRFQHLLGPTLEGALGAALKGNAQAILLLNRRGFAGYISCQNKGCGFVLSCDQCDANLVLHKHQSVPAGGFVRCHHCEAEQLVPPKCPACGQRLNLFSGGTQRLEEELTRKFGGLGLEEGRTMLRVDSDSMRSGRDYFEVLDRFGTGEVRLLLGTQMIAKGLDFPGVRLVGVIDADTALNIPDFRATERTFQLVSQVAGRAGRGDRPGAVIVQTNSPTNPAIVLASRHDYVTFANAELAIRRRSGLPPASRMARIVCRDASVEKAEARAKQLVDALRQDAPPSAGVRGPLACPITRIAGQYRYGIDVVAPSASILAGVLRTLRTKGLLTSDAKTAVDVDPVALM